MGEIRHFYKIKNDLAVEDGLIYYEDRLFVPKKLRTFVINRFHETHLGSNKIRKVAKKTFLLAYDEFWVRKLYALLFDLPEVSTFEYYRTSE